MIFLELFWTFFVIGAFTIGGGYAMLSLIESEVVFKHCWITEQEFTDIVAISQMTPGPIGINSATYIGYEVTRNAGFSDLMCVLGSFSTTFALVLPSFIIVILLCKLYERVKGSELFDGMMLGLRPTVVGLIASAAILLITPDNFPDWKSWVLLAGGFCAAMWTKIHPIALLAIAALLGIIIY